MKDLTTLLLVALAVLSLTACSGSEDEVRSKDWYIAHSEEQAVQLDICVKRPAMVKEPNCISATEAETVLSQGHEVVQAYVKSHGLNNSKK
jgi:hypothetical protein